MPKIWTKIQSTAKPHMSRATTLCHSKKIYTSAAGDVRDIKKVCIVDYESPLYGCSRQGRCSICQGISMGSETQPHQKG